MDGFDVMFRDDRDWVSFGRTYLASEGFRTLFRDGMALVEETAAYLDGDGREESKLISHNATLAYAGESMRLTTRLMQIASWLLVQRAVAEGEISSVQALEEKRRVKLSSAERPLLAGECTADLPLRLKALVERSQRLHARVLHLDALISDDRPTPKPAANEVAAQHGLLRTAFRNP